MINTINADSLSLCFSFLLPTFITNETRDEKKEILACLVNLKRICKTIYFAIEKYTDKHPSFVYRLLFEKSLGFRKRIYKRSFLDMTRQCKLNGDVKYAIVCGVRGRYEFVNMNQLFQKVIEKYPTLESYKKNLGKFQECCEFENVAKHCLNKSHIDEYDALLLSGSYYNFINNHYSPLKFMKYYLQGISYEIEMMKRFMSGSLD